MRFWRARDAEFFLRDSHNGACKPEVEIREHQRVEHNSSCRIQHYPDCREQHDRAHQSPAVSASVPCKLERRAKYSGKNCEQRKEALPSELHGVFEVSVVGS